MEQKKQLNTTLTLIMDGDNVLLGQKKRGFAKGTFNGIGGKQDPGETIEQAMIRETQEEIGVTPLGTKLVANIDFLNINYKGERVNINLSVYTSNGYKGEIQETDEMIPYWFNKNHLPFEQMLPDDVLWFNKVFNGNFIKGTIKYDDNMNRIAYNITEEKQQPKKQNQEQEKEKQ